MKKCWVIVKFMCSAHKKSARTFCEHIFKGWGIPPGGGFLPPVTVPEWGGISPPGVISPPPDGPKVGGISPPLPKTSSSLPIDV